MHQSFIIIRDARENNLRSVSLDIPRNKLVVVTGVSGSGKSSLIYDVLFREAERRYFSTFTSRARQVLGRISPPEVGKIDGLSPAVAIGQQVFTAGPRSTVGTLTGLYDLLRLLYARIGIPDYPIESKINRSLFSFNTPDGSCPVCKGLGVEDRLDPGLLIADPALSLRQGALKITAPNGYIIYSQVTMDVLAKVCEAEGFSVDTPWKELSPGQRDIVFFGSDKIEIPFGKHPLESRMRWKGITARPRETGVYKGIIPVMENILQRDRNKNILRFVRTTVCRACNGQRLNPEALAVKIRGLSIHRMVSLQIDELQDTIERLDFTGSEKTIAGPIQEKISGITGSLIQLGLGYLTTGRESSTLHAGEAQRLRLAAQAGLGLEGLIYILDEPSVGLHPSDSRTLINTLKTIRDKGNTVIVVEHDEEFIHHADWLIDIGPGPGTHGGEVIFSSAVQDLDKLPEEVAGRSRTLAFLLGKERILPEGKPFTASAWHPDETTPEEIRVTGADRHNLKNITVTFQLNRLNVVTGVSGAGKSSLVLDTLVNFLENQRGASTGESVSRAEITGHEAIRKLIVIDRSPIGRTPRSNPATYTGLFDHIRNLYASLPLSRERGYGRSRFSFNTHGGRCETCQGAGYLETGMHFLGSVEWICDACNGRRFDEKTLEVTCNGKTISETLDMTVEQAMTFFHDHPVILKYLEKMNVLGLGYLQLGQRSSTLSGGEAQRIKLATELVRPASGHTLFIMEEPTTGLHSADIGNLLNAFRDIIVNGHTIILIENHPALVSAASHIIDLGPGSGNDGGTVVASGTPDGIIGCSMSLTGRELKRYRESHGILFHETENESPAPLSDAICLNGVTTNNLKNIHIRIPHNRITVVTGVSGSGKSSLAFDTLFAEGYNRYMESFSAYARSRIGMKEKPDLESVSGLTPVFAVDQRAPGANPRSTTATYTGIYDLIRILFSRFSRNERGEIPGLSSRFSFNQQQGACPGCSGLGTILSCNPAKLITHPERSLLAGAMDGTKTGRFYGEPDGRYVATLKTIGSRLGISFDLPWDQLDTEAGKIAMEGTGDELYEVRWEFRRKNRTGTHTFTGKWDGFCNLVNEEFGRKHADHRGDEMLPLMQETVCSRCNGTRLKGDVLNYRIGRYNIHDFVSLQTDQAIRAVNEIRENLPAREQCLADQALVQIRANLEVLDGLGLSYMTLNRPVSGLSGGEFRRLRVAGQLGAGFTGITCILDEPTAGLHPSDTARMLDQIFRIREAGNTVVLVEHDPDVIRVADHVIDLGPGGGDHGGYIIAAGTPAEISSHPDSITGKALSRALYLPDIRNRPAGPGLKIGKASARNRKHISPEFPSGVLTVVTGVSGSGKSTLLDEVILRSYREKRPVNCEWITGFERFSGVTEVRQKVRFSDSRGTPATHTGLFDKIRNLFAASPEARETGLKKSHFSFLSPDGRCDHCGGTGKIRIPMDILADFELVCESCGGSRYKESVLSFRLFGKTIAEILDLSFSSAMNLFREVNPIRDILSLICRAGLGYLKLGQPLNSLSGGEAQRLTLVTELLSSRRRSVLYLFDEPTTGLHPADLPGLFSLFSHLLDEGHTLLVIEHNPEMILRAGWIIDLGPEAGGQGGNIVFSGQVSEIVNCPDSLTGRFLSRMIRG